MDTIRLPAEVISLVHHIELNKAGWDKIAVKRLLLAAVWLSESPLSSREIIKFLSQEFHISIGTSRANRSIRECFEEGSLVRVDGNKVSLSQAELLVLESELREVEQVTQRAKSRFVSACSDLLPTIDSDKAWTLFNQDFLEPLFHSVGASTYQLLLGRTFVTPPRLEKFLVNFSDELHKSLSAIVVRFFDPKDPNLRAFLLRSLNACFLIESTGLRKETIEALSKSGKPSFEVFFDTNFVFSILQLHDNPSNDAALSLLKLISKVSDHVDVKTCILPITFDEARHALSSAEDSFGGVPVAPNVAEAAMDLNVISGLTRTFLDRVKKSPFSISPDEHFGSYTRNLNTLLSSRNVQVTEVDLSEIRSHPTTLADIEEQRYFETTKFGTRAKRYSQIEHDILLWHYVHDARPYKVESPYDAGCWVITIDYRLLGFDTYKRTQLNEDIPVCVHPTTFIHLLHFWVPRTREFEEALISSIQLPFLFQEFDPQAENVTLRIIRTISRFEDASELSSETVRSILLNDALRQRISEGGDVPEQLDTIRELMIDHLHVKETNIKQSETQIMNLEVAGKNWTLL